METDSDDNGYREYCERLRREEPDDDCDCDARLDWEDVRYYVWDFTCCAWLWIVHVVFTGLWAGGIVAAPISIVLTLPIQYLYPDAAEIIRYWMISLGAIAGVFGAWLLYDPNRA